MPIVWINEKPLPIVRAGDGPGILYNRDTSRPLYIGNDSSIVHGNVNSASILDPLASLFVEGDVDVWMAAPVGTIPDNAVPLDFIHTGRSQHFPSASILAGSGTNDALLQQILDAILALQPSGGGLKIAGESSFSNVAVSGTRVTAGSAITIPVPTAATQMMLFANASGQMTALAGIMLEVQYQFTLGQPVIVPIQTGYQGGQATLSGMSPNILTVPGGEANVTVTVLATDSAGTWTISGGATILFQ